ISNSMKGIAHAWKLVGGESPPQAVRLRSQACPEAGSPAGADVLGNAGRSRGAEHCPGACARESRLNSTDEDTAIFTFLSDFIKNGPGTTDISDADSGDPLGGIAVTGAAGNGSWEYTVNFGTTYSPLTGASTPAAVLLPENALLRYTPDGANGEVASLSYVAWDQSSGSPGNVVDLTVTGTGGTTAFSNGSDTASLSVTDLNDAPVVVGV